MEKTKDIPGWYQRLMNHCTKPASELTFKQYCRENETKMKILYPFLPIDQLKGKLFARWKKSQPLQYDSSFGKTRLKKQNKPAKMSVMHLFSRASKHLPATRGKKTGSQIDWLDRNRDEKTYKGRAFVLPTKVPEVISDLSTQERSILKNGSVGASASRKRKQTASQVNFTLNDGGNQSPTPYSPPSPFVLSPVSDEDQNRDVSFQKQNILESNPQEHRYSGVTPSHKTQLSTQKRSLRNSTEMADSQIHSPDKTMNKILSPNQSPKKHNSFERKRKPVEGQLQKQWRSRVASKRNVRDKENPKVRKTSRERVDDQESNCNMTLLASQQKLEPPKFGPLVPESPDNKDKRFCLFEDENIKSTPVITPSSRKMSAAPMVKSKRTRPYSWSPTVGCSQQTPRVKKSRDGMFSQTRLQVYHRQKRRTRAGNAKYQLSPKKSHTSKREKQTKARSNENLRVTRQTTNNSAALTQTEDGSISRFSSHDRNRNMPKAQHGQDCRENTEQSDPVRKSVKKDKMAAKQSGSILPKHLQATGQDDLVTKNKNHSRKQNFSPKESFGNSSNYSVESAKRTKGKAVNIGSRNSLTKMQTMEQINDKKGITDTDPSLKSLPSTDCPDHSQPTASPQKPGEKSSPSPPASKETDVLRQILLQLKSTTPSQSGPPDSASSPAHSVSEMMSMNSPFNGEPDRLHHSDSEGDPQLPSTGKVQRKRTLNKTNVSVVYRKRGNFLCNMFDASNSDISVSTQAKRYLPRESHLKDGDFSMLFTGDSD